MRQADNIRQVEDTGIDWMGFIFYPPSPRYVRQRPDYLPLRAKRVGVFVDADTDFIVAHQREYQLHMVQLHGKETPSDCRRLKELMPHTEIVKAFGIGSIQDLAKVADYEGVADYFVFDTATKLKGGSGKTFNHSLLDHYEGHTPFLLSGGLSLDNQTETIAFRHPQLIGYDLNSCFELQPGIKDHTKIKQYINNLTPHHHE